MKALYCIFLGVLLLCLSACEKDTSDNGATFKSPSAPKENSGKASDHSDNLADIEIPDHPVSGNILSRPFHPDEVILSDTGELVFWTGDRFLPDARINIPLPLTFGESPAGRAFDFRINGGGRGRPTIRLEFKKDRGPSEQKTYKDQYRLSVQFGQAFQGELPGRIYLHIPEPKTKIAGTFKVVAPEDPTQPLEDWQRPYVHGRILFSPSEERNLSAGYAGRGDDGAYHSNAAGLALSPESAHWRGWVNSTTFKPTTTAMWFDAEKALQYRHVRMKPGMYLFYLRWEDQLIAHKWGRVGPDAMLKLDFAVDLSKSGSLAIEVPRLGEHERIWILPLNQKGLLPDGLEKKGLWRVPFHMQVEAEYKGNTAIYKYLPPGRYWALYNDSIKEVTIASGKRSKVFF